MFTAAYLRNEALCNRGLGLLPTEERGQTNPWLTFVSWYSSKRFLIAVSSLAWRSNTSCESDLMMPCHVTSCSEDGTRQDEMSRSYEPTRWRLQLHLVLRDDPSDQSGMHWEPISASQRKG